MPLLPRALFHPSYGSAVTAGAPSGLFLFAQEHIILKTIPWVNFKMTYVSGHLRGSNVPRFFGNSIYFSRYARSRFSLHEFLHDLARESYLRCKHNCQDNHIKSGGPAFQVSPWRNALNGRGTHKETFASNDANVFSNPRACREHDRDWHAFLNRPYPDRLLVRASSALTTAAMSSAS